MNVGASVAGLGEAIVFATAALEKLAGALQEDCGVDDLLWDEITRLRQELNGTRDELRKAREALKASQDRWQDLTKPGTAWWPLPAMGTAVPAPPAWVTTTGTNTFPAAYNPGGVVSGPTVWSAPLSGEYTISTTPAALQMPGTLTITSGGTSETISVSNVTLDGVRISSEREWSPEQIAEFRTELEKATSLSPILPVPGNEPYAITKGRMFEYPVIWNLPETAGTDQYGNLYGVSPTATEDDPPSAAAHPAPR